MVNNKKVVHIVGAGLAGSECAFQLAESGFKVELYEMRPTNSSPAHKTHLFAELVCSNSLGSQTDYSAPGQLKWEAERLNSLILKAARHASVPAGMALGVDREVFSNMITKALSTHPHITVHRQTITDLTQLPRPTVIATGPLTHPALADAMVEHLKPNESAEGPDYLYFFDAIAPIIDTESINMEIAWKGDRWDKGTKDYINCPLNKEQYFALIEEIKSARKIEFQEFEKNTPYFEACMPIEEIIARGDQTLRFGPLSGKGLTNPHTGRTEYAVVQLRQENKMATAYNMVGFQTKMAYGEQKRVLKMIPGLENADFLKLGGIHRNLYIHSPKKLSPFLASKKDPLLFFAGQITGVEGYFESTCIGLLVSYFVKAALENKTEFPHPPQETALGGLLKAITEDKKYFQPTNINFSLLPPVEDKKYRGRGGRENRRAEQIRRAQEAFLKWKENLV